jgi:twinkle protein
MRFYGVLTRVGASGEPQKIAFDFGGQQQIRGFSDKHITTQGSTKDSHLFGMDKFSPGQNKYVVITEGAYDAMATYQMLDSRIPVVSVRSSVQARKDCEKDRDWLNRFERIYLCLDSDQPGEAATREVAMLFDINKVYHLKLGKFKDANEYLQNNEVREFQNLFSNARPYMPKDIVASWDEIDRILSGTEAPTIGEYPFHTLNRMAYGIRAAEYVLFTAFEKVGKTEVIRAIEYHLLKTTEENIGIIHLEEREKRTIEGLAGYELNAPVHLPDSGFSVSDISDAFRTLSKQDGRVHFYSHFGSDDPNIILDVIRYLVTVRRCRFIFLDHLTMLVTGFKDEDERKELDFLSTRLAMMTRELDFTLFLVSHVNDDGQTRGSRNIAKVADLIINLDRDIEAATLEARNKTYISVRGNRFAGLTGPAGVLWFDNQTFKLKEMEVEDVAGSLRDSTEGKAQQRNAF